MSLFDFFRPKSSSKQLARAIERGEIDRAYALVAKNPDLLSQGAPPPLVAAIQAEAWELVTRLLEFQPDINATFEGMTPLHYAIEKGKPSIARELVKAGADVNARDNNGRTPIFYAATTAVSDVKLLLEAGAEMNAQDNFGQTFLHDRAKRIEKCWNDGDEANAREGAERFNYLVFIYRADPTIRDQDGKLPNDYCSKLQIKKPF